MSPAQADVLAVLAAEAFRRARRLEARVVVEGTAEIVNAPETPATGREAA